MGFSDLFQLEERPIDAVTTGESHERADESLIGAIGKRLTYRRIGAVAA